jgi:hypothetical protein
MEIWDDVRHTKITVKDNQESEAERLIRGPGPQYLIKVHIIRLGELPRVTRSARTYYSRGQSISKCLLRRTFGNFQTEQGIRS